MHSCRLSLDVVDVGLVLVPGVALLAAAVVPGVPGPLAGQ